MIRVDSLTRTYGDLTAVDQVSFEIGQGEIVGLLGHNGAGKTTIMKMLTGYLEPTGGSIVIDGLDITGAPPVAAAAEVAVPISAEIPQGDIPAATTGETSTEGGNKDVENNIVSMPTVDTPDASAGMIDPFAIAPDIPQQDEDLAALAEEGETPQVSKQGGRDDIFAIFDEVDEPF